MAHDGTAKEQASSKQLVTICHDLRQYVAAGLLLSQMPGDEDLDDDVRRRFDMLHEQFRYAADLIATVSGDPTSRAWRVDLATLVGDCVEVVRLTHEVSVEVDAQNHVEVYGDPVLLRRAVANLLDNACRAVSSTGHVVARVGDSGTEAWVEVVDDGRGFGQMESGTGHGLSIVNAALQASTGRLQISSGPGPGTTVRMVLPLEHKVAS